MDALKSLIQPLVGGAGGSSVVDGMKLVVLGGTVETARRVSSSAWSHFVNSFFLTAHFSEEDYPYDWLMLWLSRRPEWQRSREFETTTRTTALSSSSSSAFPDNSFGDDDCEDDDGGGDDANGDDIPGKVKTRVVFQPTFDTTHTIYYRGHWLRVRRGRKNDGCEMLSISVIARSNTILKQLILQAKKQYEAMTIHRIQIYLADSHGSWRWTDSKHKRPMGSIVLNPGVKEMLLNDAKDFLGSEKWYADRGIPFRRGYLLHGVPGSGKSSLIHAIAGQLLLDIYVVSLSASWISDSTLTTLMGRVPARCVLLLEDLDAAFVRSVSREGAEGNDSSNNNSNGANGEGEDGRNGNGGSGGNSGGGSGSSGRRSGRRGRDGDQLSDVNTLSLSGLLNALDGVAAAEGRILFATTNHLERLDPALSRPGRMDVWVEFKNASKWQAEALFRNFFPSTDDDEDEDLGEEEVPMTPTSSVASGDTRSTLWSMSGTFGSSSSSLAGSSPASPSPPASSRNNSSTRSANSSAKKPNATPLPQFGSSNQTYLPPPVDDHILSSQHSAKPLDGATLGMLAKRFADGVPEEEFSVAALQGYLLKNKSQPESAANGIGAWVVSEREMKERLKKEKEARDIKEKLEREKREKKKKEEEHEKKELEKKELELAKIRQQLAEKEKEKEEAEKKKKVREAAEKEEQDAEVVAAQKKAQEEEEAKKKKEEEVKKVEGTESEEESEDSDEENIPPRSMASSSSWGRM